MFLRNPKTDVTWQDEAERLWNAIRTLQSELDQVREASTEARLRYIEGLDKMLNKLQGRLAAKMRKESREDDADETNGQPEASEPPLSVLARRSPLRGW